jgi:hypothetical protein
MAKRNRSGSYKKDVGGVTGEMMKLFLLATTIPLVFLLIVPHNLQSAFAWSLFNGFNGFHHWGFNNYGQFGCGPYCQGQRDAQYDHDNNLVYDPYPQCCHSEYYQQAFHQGYDQQWNIYQSQDQEQQTNQRSNIYINNSPGAYVNTEQNSNQEQGQSQEQGPSWTSPDNTNGDCSNGCPWRQGP